MNRKTSLLTIIALVVLGLVAGWYAYDRYTQQQVANEAGQYVTYRQDSLQAVQDIELSQMISDDPNLSEVGALIAACRNLDVLVEEVPAEVAQGEYADVAAIESDYPLDEWRSDVERYRDICWYSATYDDNSLHIEAALESDEHQNFLLDLPNCSYGLCFKPDLSQEYHQWRSDNILKLHQANRDYYRNTDCPLAVDGGEQFCTALANYAASSLSYEILYLQQIADDQLTSNDPDMLREFGALNSSFESLQRITSIIGDFDSPYQVYRTELSAIEQRFSEKL